MPQYWLLKTEPSDYSYSDLEKDKTTVWDGVHNNLALKHLREMKKGDLAFIYHTGKEKALTGIGEVTSDPYPDPREKDAKLVVVDIRAKQKLKYNVSLADVKSDARFSDFALVRLPRLSVMPLTKIQWENLLGLAK